MTFFVCAEIEKFLKFLWNLKEIQIANDLEKKSWKKESLKKNECGETRKTDTF